MILEGIIGAQLILLIVLLRSYFCLSNKHKGEIETILQRDHDSLSRERSFRELMMTSHEELNRHNYLLIDKLEAFVMAVKDKDASILSNAFTGKKPNQKTDPNPGYNSNLANRSANSADLDLVGISEGLE